MVHRLIPSAEETYQVLLASRWRTRPTGLMSKTQRCVYPPCTVSFAADLIVIHKVLTLQTILTILNSTKSTEVSSVIKALSQDSQDALMKYLYKGMAMPGWGDISGSVLLGWHEKVRSSRRFSVCHSFASS